MNNIVLPQKEDEKNSLFFILNRIYSKEGNKVFLNSDDIQDLYKVQKNKSSKYIDDVMNSIDIEIDKRISKEEYNRESKKDVKTKILKKSI